ncbi:MAG: hypothetical protein ACHQYP_09490 [Nitrospiria bacterium]
MADQFLKLKLKSGGLYYFPPGSIACISFATPHKDSAFIELTGGQSKVINFVDIDKESLSSLKFFCGEYEKDR